MTRGRQGQDKPVGESRAEAVHATFTVPPEVER